MGSNSLERASKLFDDIFVNILTIESHKRQKGLQRSFWRVPSRGPLLNLTLTHRERRNCTRCVICLSPTLMLVRENVEHKRSWEFLISVFEIQTCCSRNLIVVPHLVFFKLSILGKYFSNISQKLAITFVFYVFSYNQWKRM